MPAPPPAARSEEVDDLLGAVPSWLVRAGNSLLWLVFAILLALGFLVQYPDVVSARIHLTAEIPPARLIARQSGRLQELLAHEGQRVAAGDWLAVLESSAEPGDVRRVMAQLPALGASLQAPSPDLAAALAALPPDVQLGSLHLAYAALIRSLRSYQLFAGEGYHAKKAAMLAAQLRAQRQIAASSRDQLEIVRRELALATRALDRERALQGSGASSPADVEAAELGLQQTQRLAAELAAQLFDQELRIQEHEKAELDLRNGKQERGQDLLLAVHEAEQRLVAELAEWEQRFALRAPIAGRVALHQVWAVNQQVTADTEVMAVVPERRRLFGRIELAQRSSGKVQLGQRVNIMLDGFPAQEYGVLHGTVQAIAPLAQGGAYTVHVELSGDELRSSYDQLLEFKDDMQGSCDIVTAELSVIERILNKVLYRVKRR